MKRLTSIFTACAGLAIAVALIACSDQSQPQSSPSAALAMPLDKPGVSAELDFSVTQEQVDSGRRMMVAVEFPQTKDGQLEDALIQQDIPIALEVTWLHDQQATPVVTQDNRAILGAAPSENRASSIAVLHLYAHDADTSYALIAGFYPPQSGRYRATIKTVENQPLFANVKTTIRVAPFYNTGK